MERQSNQNQRKSTVVQLPTNIKYLNFVFAIKDSKIVKDIDFHYL